MAPSKKRTSECKEPCCSKKPQTDVASSGSHQVTSFCPTDASLEVNPAWVTIYGQVAADAVLDFIGEFDMDAGERRDPEAARRFVYHFNITAEIGRCRHATAEAFPLAFALSPRAVSFGAVGVQVIPLAFCAVVHKIGVRQDDAERSTFFYL